MADLDREGSVADEEDLTEAAEELASTGGAELETRHAVVSPSQHGQRLDLGLVALAPEFSRSHLQGLVAAGHVQVDGTKAKAPSQKLRAGQDVQLLLVPTEESQAFRPQAMALDIVFEDEHLLVLNKPAGLVVHPAAGHWQGTLLNGLLAHHPAAARLARAGIVHRLDKDTSGLMVVAKSQTACTKLVRAIAAREVHRQYLALVHSAPTASALPRWSRPQRGQRQPPPTVEAPIARDPASRLRMAVVAGGKDARTDFEVLAQSADGVLALRCTLHSGRTHQIRVHAAFGGFPLLADALYGGRPMLGLQRQALHAHCLSFAHPVSGAALSFEQTPPADFATAWAQVAA